VDAIADQLVERREIYGDDLLELLDRQDLAKPEIDWSRDDVWPKALVIQEQPWPKS
jgi:hypothetical protein